MALEVPPTFIATHTTRPDDGSRSLFRLPTDHQLDLQDVARGVEESDAGVCCSYLIDTTSGEGGDFDEFAPVGPERFADSAIEFIAYDIGLSVPRVSRWRQKILRCRRALSQLRESGDHRSVSVLHVAYGYPDPIVRQLPELLGMSVKIGVLVRYTDVVEEKRQEMVRTEAARRSTSDVVDLNQRRSMIRYYDRIVSSADALRAALAPFSEPLPTPKDGEGHLEYEARREARRNREEAHRNRRSAFLTRAKVEAVKMLARAEEQYHQSWLTTTS